ncbi:MAG: gamma carbonic anhydrase family protein [Spirochaetaceae bacterium]|jgi:carbonic anhydrase/acetyltransferase-like protein (isoleucine patch superfamily)|nr:gamma carbonic anhydrase family protein [Spirochaetaceae bacterium]
MIYPLGEDIPELRGQGHYLAPSCSVVGRVILESRVNIWFNAVLRGDVEYIHLGEDTNFQDCAVGHTDFGFPLILGSSITVGHGAILHGCQVGDHSLIGMNAVVLNGAKVGKHCLIGAQSLVPQGRVIPDYSIFLGSPGTVVKTLSPEAAQKIKKNGQFYVSLAERYLKECLMFP